jgi:hypothetical protein
MKSFALLAFLLPFTVAAQSKTDYEKAMAKFQKFYNAAQGDSINALFGQGWDEMKKTNPLWTNAKAAEYLKEYGKLKSFRFVGVDKADPNKVHVFQTVFAKAGTRTSSLTLDEDNASGTFRFITTSESINELLRRFKSSR